MAGDRPNRAPAVRHRGDGADRAILDAVRAMLLERPFADLRIEHVAARAGVGKTTIYRRWRTREDLAAAALIELAGPIVAVPDLGDTRAELLAAVQSGIRAVSETDFGPILAAMMAQIATRPAVRDRFRDELVAGRRQALAEAVRRGIARGDIRSDADPELALELLTAPTYYRLLFGGSLDPSLGEAVVTAYLRAHGTST
jgi:AcrR family transcriptional regulator